MNFQYSYFSYFYFDLILSLSRFIMYNNSGMQLYILALISPYMLFIFIQTSSYLTPNIFLSYLQFMRHSQKLSISLSIKLYSWLMTSPSDVSRTSFISLSSPDGLLLFWMCLMPIMKTKAFQNYQIQSANLLAERYFQRNCQDWCFNFGVQLLKRSIIFWLN